VNKEVLKDLIIAALNEERHKVEMAKKDVKMVKRMAKQEVEKAKKAVETARKELETAMETAKVLANKDVETAKVLANKEVETAKVLANKDVETAKKDVEHSEYKLQVVEKQLATTNLKLLETGGVVNLRSAFGKRGGMTLK